MQLMHPWSLNNFSWNCKIAVDSRLKMLHEMYDSMSEDQRTDMAIWAKEQITQNFFNCTMRPSSDPISSKQLIRPFK